MGKDKKVTWDLFILVLLVLLYSHNFLYEGNWKSVRDSLDLFADNHRYLDLVKFYFIRAFCCYVITVRFPASVWFVPLLFNFGTVGLLLIPSFWQISSGWLFAFGGIALSYAASIIGMKIANRTA